MSRVGKAPINISPGVTMELRGQHLTVSGPRGDLSRVLPEPIGLTIEDNVITYSLDKK